MLKDAASKAKSAYHRRSRSFSVGWLILPLFVGMVWVGAKIALVGSPSRDVVMQSLINTGVFSIRVFAVLYFIHLVSHKRVWGWDLDNEFRERLQRMIVGDILEGEDEPRPLSDRIGSFVVISGEVVVKCWFAWLLLTAFIRWPNSL